MTARPKFPDKLTVGEFTRLFAEATGIPENRFHPLVWILGEPEIGEGTYIGGFSEINAQGARVSIGKNCDIASFVSINCADSHKRCVGISESVARCDITIGDSVFIGSHSIIKGGAQIGHHSVVAAGTVVGPELIAPYSLVAGNPMRVKSGYYLKPLGRGPVIPHNRPCLGAEEVAAAVAVLSSGWLAQGKEVSAFEDELCAFLGLPEGHGVAVSSGSAALYLALLALEARGRGVAAPAYSCRAVQNAIELVGGTAYWLDVGDNSPNADFRALPAGAIELAIVAHMFGIPARLPPASSVTVIEDCAQALGAEIAGRRVGTLGKIGIFSFAATKLITSGGQGGMLVSSDGNIVEFVRKVRDYDSMPDAHPRFNFQMTDVQAAIGRRQLAKLPEFLARRERIFQRYRESGIELMGEASQEHRAVRFRAVVRTADPSGWQSRFNALGIKTIVPVLEDELLAPPTVLPRSLALSRTTLSLPIYPDVVDEQVDTIVQNLVHDR